ncbi:hypothetical protein BTUL_0009g00020 [Botrytis tulipae]|uniref:Helicase C-terminal domain-containing protein n=1 Tax=Botrytis tulipae TaxID=87230 RepID=A0A4Z1F1K8_9HELO|nr:hypothetical protein BTUL_0009g00020 [Botrytis tulipae]
MDPAKEPGNAARNGSRVKDAMLKLEGKAEASNPEAACVLETGNPETEVVVERTELEGSAHVARRLEKMHMESGNVAAPALGHNGSAFDQLGTNVTLEPQTIALETDKETWTRSHDWSGLPLHATLIESLRVTKDMRQPTPTQAPLEKTLGYVVSASNEVLRAHIEKKKIDDPSSAVLKPTVLVILPTNAMATQLRALFDRLLAVLNGRINRKCPSEVRCGDIVLECHGAYEGIIEAIGSMSVRRILVAPTRLSEHTDAGKRWLTPSYKWITTASETDVATLLHISCGFVRVECKEVSSQLFTIYETVLEIVYKSRQMGAGIKNILVFLDTREETEWLGKLFEYDGDVTLPFNGTDLEGKKLGKKLYDKLYYSYTSMSRRNGSVYSNIHDVLADETRTFAVVCGTTDIMRNAVDAPIDVVLQFLKRPSKYKDCTHEKIMETWYSRAGRVGRYDRTGISYTYFRPGVDDHAASEFIKIEEQHGDVAMQFLLDAKARHDKQKGTVNEVKGGDSSSKS